MAIVLVIVWLWGCFCADAWLEQHMEDADRRISITPFLGAIWLPIVIGKFLVVRHLEEIFTELNHFSEIEEEKL
ncbi:MAG TPA: hypothetical protein VHC21_03170 [Candidatus Saccharimonadales bacterium]|nr:hypothetical protein [Candidatus Saccharimonadales bacterium]